MGLLLGLIITLAAIVAYSTYITVQLSGLRKLQSDLVDRNRKDSLQLLRLQNDLNSVALAMRDMLESMTTCRCRKLEQCAQGLARIESRWRWSDQIVRRSKRSRKGRR